MNQKGFLTIISLLIVVIIILLMAIIILKTTVFWQDNEKQGQPPNSLDIPQPSNLLELPQQIEKELKAIEKKYQNGN